MCGILLLLREGVPPLSEGIGVLDVPDHNIAPEEYAARGIME
jgi:hypothetical protein